MVVCATLLCLLTLPGCFFSAKPIDVSRLAPPYQISVYQKGQQVARRKVEAMSEDEQALAHWIEANRGGWRKSHGKYEPGRVVTGDGFTLNFTDDACVLHLEADPNDKTRKSIEPVQLVKRLPPGDIELARVLDQMGPG